MNFGIIGCGLIGRKRAESLPSGYLRAVADVSRERAESLAGAFVDVEVVSRWEDLVSLTSIDAVIVSTTNNWLAPIVLAAVESGKHVLVEKPGALHYTEIDPIIQAAERMRVQVMVGYNLRCHPSLKKAYELVREGNLGPILYVRGRYGHGGRIGYEKEWRADRSISGGGELMDQGVHLIDLSRWFLGDFSTVQGNIHTFFWDMPVEDNGFLYLKTGAGQVAWLQVSCTEWKNLFSYEIFCKHGKLQVDGLGGSYGVERLTRYAMLPEMGPPETTIWEYPFPDNSWQIQFSDFERAITGGTQVSPNLNDAREALVVVHTIYGGSR